MTAENRKIILFLQISFVIVSLVSLTSISIDRFLMVAYPIKHRILMKGKVIVLCLAVIWIFGCSLCDNTSLWPAEQNLYVQRWCDYYHNIGSHLRCHVSQIEKTIEEHSTTKLKRKSRTRDTNPERKEIFKHHHSYSMCRLPLHRAFHGVFSDLSLVDLVERYSR